MIKFSWHANKRKGFKKLWANKRYRSLLILFLYFIFFGLIIGSVRSNYKNIEDYINKYNEYWDYFTQFKIWSNNAMKKSYIEFMCRYSIEWSGKSVSEILNNKTEWFSYLTKELVYLLKNYYDIIEPWIYRRWGDEKMEPKINIDYIKKEG